VVVTFVTGNTNLVPTVILLGSFLVPVTFATYAFERADQVLTAQRILAAFVYGGVLGVLGASVLEAAFLTQPSALTYLGVGLIEEAVKLAALWLLALGLPRYSMRDGIVLGAAVGLGFAALESAGYAFDALFTMEGLSLPNLVETEVLRRLLTRWAMGCGPPSWVGCCSAPPPTAVGCGCRARWSAGTCWWRGCMRCGTPPDRSRCG
jgi:RsiW-degrading membrane proteinase PrsW (M82 family)